ncbi:MAG TPA: zf-HC2 domain-containing protein [Bryobacteraceae bacterium]|nr:zf-HC2 domain-containing protein [Bryobacteraceae bacterium]
MPTCEQFEILLADYIDETLDRASREEFTRHLESCAACAAYAADVQGAVSFIEIAAEVEPPAALTARILEATHEGWEFKLRARGVRGWINRTFAPVLKPRFAMGAMMTMMSLTMLSRCAGPPDKPLTAADLDPIRLWSSLDDRTHRLWDRTVKSYESMRLVYEIKSQLNEWKQQQSEAEETAAEAHANSRRLDGAKPEKTSASQGPNHEPSPGSTKENQQ